MYFGGIIIEDGKSTKAIGSRIIYVISIFLEKKKLLSAKHININIKKKLIKTYNRSVALYGYETRRINKKDKMCWRL